jgi:hypothetical protein
MARLKEKPTEQMTREDRDARTAVGLCRMCDPPANPAFCVGLCTTCYRVMDRKTKRGEWDRDQLVEQGFILPAAPRGRKGGSGIEKAVSKVKGGPK